MSIIEKAFERLVKQAPIEPQPSEISVKPVADAEMPAPVIEDSDLPAVKAADLRDAAGPGDREAFTQKFAAEVKLDLKKFRSLGILTPDNTESAVAEEFRKIKQPLLANIKHQESAGEGAGNKILVTSSVKGEGKTRSAVNLCISMALELDRTVLLIDTDVVMSGASKLLGVESRIGLTDVLTNSDVKLEDVIVSTNIDRLTVLPVGTRVSSISELYASDVMAALLRELGEADTNRVVIFDSPPVLGAAEVRVLAENMDQIVIVVEAEKTPEHVMHETLGVLESTNVVGFILNKSNLKIRSDYHYGYYQ